MESRVVRYSEAFKLQVIREIEEGKFTSPFQASQAYGITGKGTVAYWMRQYGKDHLLKKVVRVSKKGEMSELKRLKERTRQLEVSLADAVMDRGLERSAFELLCEQQNVDPEAFKKKLAASGLRPRSSKTGKSTG